MNALQPSGKEKIVTATAKPPIGVETAKMVAIAPVSARAISTRAAACAKTGARAPNAMTFVRLVGMAEAVHPSAKPIATMEKAAIQ